MLNSEKLKGNPTSGYEKLRPSGVKPEGLKYK